MAKPKVQRVAYVGGGFRIGIPARDMTMDEWETLPEAERDAALAAGLYLVVGADTPAPDPEPEMDWPLIIEDEEGEE